MKFGLFVLLSCAILSNSALSQESPYNFNWKKDLIYSSGAGLILVGGVFADYQTRPLTASQVNSLDSYALSGIDRLAINNWNPKVKTASDAVLYASMALPAFMMINKRARKDYLVVGFIYAEVAIITLGLTEFAKAGVKRPRPYVYNPTVGMHHKTERDARFSFFSGHTSLTAALCFTTAKVFSDYSENQVHEALVWTGAALVPIAVAYLRFESGQHFPTDLIAGYFVGGAIGYLVPWLHRRKPIAKGLTISPYGLNGGGGLYLSYQL